MTGKIEQAQQVDPGGEVSCSIVIRAYNEEKNIGRLLDGISHQNIRDFEIILVDSGSTDATLEIASRYSVRTLAIQPGLFSFGRSLNQGIADARGEIIVIASAHVYPVYSDWLQRLLAPFFDSQVALVYGKQRGAASTYFSEHQIFSHWYPEESRNRQPYPFCNNANAAIRRALWSRHPYDETLSGLEDLEWARWAMENGFAISYVAEAEVIHVHNESPAGIYNRYRREAMAFKRMFQQEKFGGLDFLRLCISNISSDLWHAARQRKLSAAFRSIFMFRFSQFWGTYQGFRHSGPLTSQLRQTFYYPRGLTLREQPGKRDAQPIRYNEGSEV